MQDKLDLCIEDKVMKTLLIGLGIVFLLGSLQVTHQTETTSLLLTPTSMLMSNPNITQDNVAELQIIKEIDLPQCESGVADVAWSFDNKFLAVGCLYDILIFDTENFQEVGILKGHTSYVVDLDFNPLFQWMLASASFDATLRLWNIQSQIEIAQYVNDPRPNWQSAFVSVSFDPKGNYIAGGTEEADRAVHIWNLFNNEQHVLIRTYLTGVYYLAFDHNGNFLASSDMRRIYIYNTNNKNSEIIEVAENYGVSFNPSDSLLAYGIPNKEIVFWSIESGKVLSRISVPNYSAGLTFHPYEPMISFSTTENQIEIWSINGENLITLSEGQNQDLLWVRQFSPDGKYLAGTMHNKLIIWGIPSS